MKMASITKANGFAVSGTARVFMCTVTVSCKIDCGAVLSVIIMSGIGSKYEGSWENDRINGEGTSWYNNGNRYHGEWLNGRINGLGTLYLASGDRYSGDWKDGRRHGQGTYYYRQDASGR